MCSFDLALRVEPAELDGLDYATHGQEVGGLAHVDVPLLVDGVHALERLDHDLLEAVVDLVLGPEQAVQALDPLEVGHRDATGVGQDVRDEQDAVLVEDPVRLGGVGAVGGLARDLGLDVWGVLRGDTFSRAAGIRISTSSSSRSSLVMVSDPGKPTTVPVSCLKAKVSS